MFSDTRFTTEELARLNELWTAYSTGEDGPSAYKTSTTQNSTEKTTLVGDTEVHGIGTQAPSHSVA